MKQQGQVDRLILRDVDVVRPAGKTGGCLLKTRPDALLGKLIIDRLNVENLGRLADLSQGKTEHVVLNQVLVENVGEPDWGDATVVGAVTVLP